MPLNHSITPGKTESKIDFGQFYMDMYCIHLVHQADSCVVTMLHFAYTCFVHVGVVLPCACHVSRLSLMYKSIVKIKG